MPEEKSGGAPVRTEPREDVDDLIFQAGPDRPVSDR